MGTLALPLGCEDDPKPKAMAKAPKAKGPMVKGVPLLPNLANTKRGTEAGEVRSIFPDKVAPNALAARLCNGFQTLQRKRKAQCCETKVGVLLTGECTRILSGALKDNTVVAQAPKIDSCLAALEGRFEGCGWVGDFSQAMPTECQGILTGTLDAEASCRSSLECKSGLACHGVSPTTRGTCGAPGKRGASCGRGIDPAATYLNVELLADHSVCEGFCANGRCRTTAKEGERCVSDAHCGAGNHCVNTVITPVGKKGKVGGTTRKFCRVGKRPKPATLATRPLQERCLLKASGG